MLRKSFLGKKPFNLQPGIVLRPFCYKEFTPLQRTSRFPSRNKGEEIIKKLKKFEFVTERHPELVVQNNIVKFISQLIQLYKSNTSTNNISGDEKNKKIEKFLEKLFTKIEFFENNSEHVNLLL